MPNVGFLRFFARTGQTAHGPNGARNRCSLCRANELVEDFCNGVESGPAALGQRHGESRLPQRALPQHFNGRPVEAHDVAALQAKH